MVRYLANGVADTRTGRNGSQQVSSRATLLLRQRVVNNQAGATNGKQAVGRVAAGTHQLGVLQNGTHGLGRHNLVVSSGATRCHTLGGGHNAGGGDVAGGGTLGHVSNLYCVKVQMGTMPAAQGGPSGRPLARRP